MCDAVVFPTFLLTQILDSVIIILDLACIVAHSLLTCYLYAVKAAEQRNNSVIIYLIF